MKQIIACILVLLVAVEAPVFGQDKTNITTRFYKIKNNADKVIASAVSYKSIALKALENAFNMERANESELVSVMSGTNISLIKNNNKKADLLIENTKTTRYMVEEIVFLSAEITNALLPIILMPDTVISKISEKEIEGREKEVRTAEKKLKKIMEMTETLKEKWLVPSDIIGGEAADK